MVHHSNIYGVHVVSAHCHVFCNSCLNCHTGTGTSCDLTQTTTSVPTKFSLFFLSILRKRDILSPSALFNSKSRSSSASGFPSSASSSLTGRRGSSIASSAVPTRPPHSWRSQKPLIRGRSQARSVDYNGFKYQVH